MQTTTWKDTVADPSNPWLSATRAEEEGRFGDAAVLYLRDATDCLSLGLKARAALSCGCAAASLEKMGNINAARHLYLETAKIYEEHADTIFGTSIREALWLLQEAHDYLLMAGETNKAARVYESCVSLTRKLNPFTTGELPDGMLRIKSNAQPRPAYFSIPSPPPREVSAAIDDFLRLRDLQVSKTEKPVRASSQNGTRRRASVEKSIIS